MAQYYFDVRAGFDLSEDEEGDDLVDAAAAENEARRAVLELAKDRLCDGLDEISVEVRNQSGLRILIVKASVAVDRTA